MHVSESHGIAQAVDFHFLKAIQGLYEPKVAGSSPARPTKICLLSLLVWQKKNDFGSSSPSSLKQNPFTLKHASLFGRVAGMAEW
jgi:hypothetical protein